MAKVKDLETTSRNWEYYRETYEILRDIRIGATAIRANARRYLVPRPGEDEEIYSARLRKLTFTPIMPLAIREYIGKLVSVPLHIRDADDPYWEEFLNDWDGRGSKTQDFVKELLSILLYFRTAYVGLDTFEQPHPRSEYEILSAKRQTPFCHIFSPWEVRKWGSSWVMTRQLSLESQPFGEERVIARWTIWDEVNITTFEAEVRVAEDGDTIMQVARGNRWVSVYSDLAQLQPRVVAHGLGRMPIVSLSLPTELWTGGNVWPKQIQHLIVESGYSDTLSVTGDTQRIFTPVPQPEDDPRQVMQQDYSSLQVGNPYVLIGSKYEYAESGGNASKSLGEALDRIEKQVKGLVSMYYASSNAGVLEQSGKSKEIDQQSLIDSMKDYGGRVLSLLNKILETAAAYRKGISVPQAVGMEAYDLGSVQALIDNLIAIEPIRDRLSPEALRMSYVKLGLHLHPEVDGDTKTLIEESTPAPDREANKVQLLREDIT